MPLLTKVIEVIELIMSGKVSRKRKLSWKSQVKLMNEAKAEKQPQRSDELIQHSTTDETMNESDLLPAPT